MTFPNPTSRNKNICYTLQVIMSTPKENTSKVLDTQKIEKIEIFNKLNNFYTTGTLVYADDAQIMDKYFNKPLCLVQMFFNQIINIPKVDTTISNEEESFSHSFIVKKFTILSRDEKLVRYQIDIVDVNWWKMIRNVDYTTYGNGPTAIGEILKSTFEKVGLNINGSTIQNFGTKLDYITNSSDTPMDVFRFLTSRIFYNDVDNKSISLMSYNLIKDEYFLYDLKTQKLDCVELDKYPQDNMLVLSMYDRDSLEKIIQRQQVGLGTVSHKTKTEFLESIQSRKIHSYDIKKNEFGETTIDSTQIKNIFNNTLQKGNKKINLDEMKIKDDKNIFGKDKIFDEFSYWNNDMNLYEEMVDSMINNDSLVVNINGNINRVPGADFQLFITNPGEFVDMKGTDYDVIMEKYKQYIGTWVVSSIRHIIEPKKGLFNDVICLFRNW